jgi:hypothetical protein
MRFSAPSTRGAEAGGFLAHIQRPYKVELVLDNFEHVLDAAPLE